MYMRKGLIIVGVVLLLLGGAGGLFAEFFLGRVEDISDRKYEKAVISLLDGAAESIVMSMYIINPLERGPVRLLVRDLEEALERDVRVEIYINSRFNPKAKGKLKLKEPLLRLRELGAKIYPVSSNYRMHDKLIIVDERYVVEGSVNWSVSALKSNYESATLIDSPELAKEKLIRVRQLPLEGVDSKTGQRPDRVKIEKTFSKEDTLNLSKRLLLNRNLYPNMLRYGDMRSMDAYLLLLAEAKYNGNNEFFLLLEEFGLELGMPEDWSDTAVRRKTIKTLKKLNKKYDLIDITFLHGKDAWVVLKSLPDDSFDLKCDVLYSEYLLLPTPSAKYTLLIKHLLNSEGKTIDSFTQYEISTRFFIHRDSLRKALKELSYK